MPLLDPGSKAPDFTLPDQHGIPHALSDYKGRCVVLYFYPKDNTEDCTTQACAFRDSLAGFGSLQASILGLSPDDLKSHDRFAAKQALNFPILSDPKPKSPVCRAYGTFVEKTMYGKPVTTVARTTYLIDAQGMIRARWDKKQIEADVAAHPAHVQDAIRRLAAGLDPLPLQTEPKPAGPAPTRAKTASKPNVKKAAKKNVNKSAKKAATKKKR